MSLPREILEKIEAYLSGQMSPAEKIQFETSMASSPELKQAVEQQQELMKAMENIYVKNTAIKAGQKFRLYSFLKKGGLICMIIVMIVTGTYITYTYIKQKSVHENTKEAGDQQIMIPAMDGSGTTEPGAFIPSQYFEINGKKDTVIQGNQGMMIVIPAGSFTDENGNPVDEKIKVELKEALDPATIMMSGLSTFSGDQVLETGGMFYLEAYVGEKKLKISETGILASVPQAEQKPGMMIFDGVINEDGTMNWVNPKQPENYLLPVDMMALDFYPENYVNTLREMDLHYTDKKYRDSLYLSFEEYSERVIGNHIGQLYADTSVHSGNTTEGRNLFKMHCARCHYASDQKMVGPGLKDVIYRWGDDKSLYAFIKNSTKLINSGHKYANQIFDEYNGSAMPAFNLTDQEIDHMMIYIQNPDIKDKDRLGAWITFPDTIGFTGILPSQVLSFWNTKFNNTLLATREFEQRMKLIHQSCYGSVLGIYVNNLDKKLYELDSMAAGITSGDISRQFLQFAALKQGRIENGNKSYILLKKYFEEQSRIYALAAIKTTRAFFEKNRMADVYAAKKEQDFAGHENENILSRFNEEYELNLNEAYRQLGKKRPQPSPGGFITATITTTGWKNVDRYVAESLIARTTLDYTDTSTGRKAIINYTEMNIVITNEIEFDQLHVYLIPDKLSTYMKVNKNNNRYAEKLNELIQYDLVVIGYKDGKIYSELKTNTKPSTYTFTLQVSDITTVTKLLKGIRNAGASSGLETAINYSVFQIEDKQRIKKFNQVVADREKIRPVIFPCAVMPDDSETTAVKDSISSK